MNNSGSKHTARKERIRVYDLLRPALDCSSTPHWVFYTTAKLFRCSTCPSQDGAKNKSNEDRQESYATVNSLGRDQTNTDVSYSQNSR